VVSEAWEKSRAISLGFTMIANAVLITVAILMALGFWFMGELKFFIPYKLVLWREYGTTILTYAALLSVNVFAATFVLLRKFFLKDTGRKLSHLDKQLRTGQTDVPAPWFEQESD
jgi:hypothetical protein